MSLRLAAMLAVLLPLATTPAVAQKLSSPLSFTVFAGASIPIGDSSDGLNTGYTIGAAADLRAPATPLGGRLEGSYSNWGAKGLAGSGLSADASEFGANLNLVLWFPMTAPTSISPYVTAGPSFSRFKGTVSSGGASFSQTENHWGFNAGGGVDIAIGELAVRVDARYKRISGDNGNFQSIPVTFGVRF
ncbi:MAG: outer membrane beta-barrel protein [Gemmatimonadaceae bacterium]